MAIDILILDKDDSIGRWLIAQLAQINVQAIWVPSVVDLLSLTEAGAPVICLIALRPPLSRALSLVTELSQEPRFSRTAFILMGPHQHKHAAFEAGADDYLTTPPDVIELRKRVRLYLDRASLEARVMAETTLSQAIDALSQDADRQGQADRGETLTLLQHATELAQERDLYHTILFYTFPAIVLLDADRRLVYANPAWENLTGQYTNDLIGQPVDWPPDNLPSALAKTVHATLERGQAWHGEVRYTLASGLALDVTLWINPVYDADGDRFGYVITQLDNTARHRRDYLPARFLADAAVEMRTPVTNIKMRRYLLRQAPPDQHDMHLQALEQETDRLSWLVDSMLEMARLDADTVELDKQAVDLNRLLNEAVIRYSPTAAEQQVTLGFERNETLPPVEGDPGYLARALGIVLDNAIRYTPAGGHVDVGLEHEQWEGNDFATIVIRDTGMGIAPEELPYIFDRFFRSARARSSSQRGVGLGLSIAQAILHRHNGAITVESNTNSGSVVSIWLPLS